ncbi:uncharacterized protein LOC116125898 [Pistacia vera]|uniref:uncharacterized protein LOC116125898 n=1 Tax=Pistacia vera TaxID=55513 RepID=UPI001263A1BE|nr:uncharacterized protein LOC116125898 [Pistacia vera]
MRAYLKGQGLWQYVEEEKQPPQLGPNPTLNPMRMNEEEMSKAPRALSHIHCAVTDLVFTRIMACETVKQAWDRLREEFMGSDTTQNMQVMNLRRELEMLRMQEVEKVKEYVDKLMSVVNKNRLLGVEMSDKMIVDKVYQKAQEQRRLMRQEDSNEGAMMAAQKGLNVQGSNRKGCKQFGHIEKVCKNKGAQPSQQAQSAEDQQQGSEPEQLFVALCYCMQTSGDVWLIDSGCTNHMAAKLENFVRMDRTYSSKVKVGNGDYVEAKCNNYFLLKYS